MTVAPEKPHLAIGAFSDLIILRPNSGIAIDGSAITVPEDTVLSGRLVIALPSREKLKSVRIELVGRSELDFSTRTETVETLNISVDLDATTARNLTAGAHEWVFSLRVPATTAPYERNKYGKTQHCLKAYANRDGWLVKTMVAEQNVTAVVNHNPDPQGLPLPFSMDQEHLSDALGPLKVQLTSRFLLIAGFLQLRVYLPSVGKRLRLDDVKVDIRENVTLKSYQQPGLVERKAPQVQQICSLIEGRRRDPLELSPGSSWTLDEQFRIPIFARISASTAAKSVTGLCITHVMSVKFVYTLLEDNPTRKASILDIQGDCIITACSCVLDALQLPSYTEALASKMPPLQQIGFCSECLCHIADNPALREMYGVPDDFMQQALEWRSRSPDGLPYEGAETAWKSERQRAPY